MNKIIYFLKEFMKWCRYMAYRERVWKRGLTCVGFSEWESANETGFLTKRALDGLPPREIGDVTPDDVRLKMWQLRQKRRK